MTNDVNHEETPSESRNRGVVNFDRGLTGTKPISQRTPLNVMGLRKLANNLLIAVFEVIFALMLINPLISGERNLMLIVAGLTIELILFTILCINVATMREEK